MSGVQSRVAVTIASHRSSTYQSAGRPGAARHVEDVADAAFRGESGARIPRMLVQRHEPDARVGLDQRLRAVAVVHVPVDDQHARPAGGERGVRRHHDVVDQAEAHRRVAQRVVPRRAHRGERMASRRERQVRGREHRPRGAERRVPALRVERRVAGQRTSAGQAERPHRVEVGLRVHAEGSARASRARRHARRRRRRSRKRASTAASRAGVSGWSGPGSWDRHAGWVKTGRATAQRRWMKLSRDRKLVLQVVVLPLDLLQAGPVAAPGHQRRRPPRPQ